MDSLEGMRIGHKYFQSLKTSVGKISQEVRDVSNEYRNFKPDIEKPVALIKLVELQEECKEMQIKIEAIVDKLKKYNERASGYMYHMENLADEAEKNFENLQSFMKDYGYEPVESSGIHSEKADSVSPPSNNDDVAERLPKIINGESKTSCSSNTQVMKSPALPMGLELRTRQLREKWSQENVKKQHPLYSPALTSSSFGAQSSELSWKSVSNGDAEVTTTTTIPIFSNGSPESPVLQSKFIVPDLKTPPSPVMHSRHALFSSSKEKR